MTNFQIIAVVIVIVVAVIFFLKKRAYQKKVETFCNDLPMGIVRNFFEVNHEIAQKFTSLSIAAACFIDDISDDAAIPAKQVASFFGLTLEVLIETTAGNIFLNEDDKKYYILKGQILKAVKETLSEANFSFKKSFYKKFKKQTRACADAQYKEQLKKLNF